MDSYLEVWETGAGATQKTAKGPAKAFKGWKPPTLRPWFLSAVLVLICALIVAIQCLLLYSQRNQGIIVATNISDLPLRQSFCYLYLPTLVSVTYNYLWTWIDLDVKRLEPFFQLSKPGGAEAEDSVLLHYPFDFMATLPFKALRRRHWAVFAVSIIMIMISWGLTPVQAGIFAVRTITMTEDTPMFQATTYDSLSTQGNLSAIYAQSVYNILWLNETLPPFMTRDFVLSPFGPSVTGTREHSNLTHTSMTDLYSVDVECEAPITWNRSGSVVSNSSNGCSFNAPPYRPIDNNDTTKPYDAMYVGY